MIICFECNKDTKKLLDSFVGGGEYENYSEIISVAVNNLKMIGAAVGANGSLVIASHGELPATRVDRAKDRPPPKVAVKRKIGKTVAARIVESAISSVPSVPELFKRPTDECETPDLMQLPDDLWVRGTDVPLNRWLFAMYNKLLPAKANCRALCSLAESSGNGVELETATGKIAHEALLLGDYLLTWDSKLGLNRDSSLATAFPTSTRDVDKSVGRYGNQFVANLNKYGKLTGLLFALKLINYRRTKGNTFIHLTEPGWRFARMENPVLDGDDLSDSMRFSDNEIDFLLEHIAKCVPAEDSAYRAILKLVQDDVNTPDAIDQELQSTVSDEDKERVSVSYLVSQRSGAVSRMSDLDLIRRVRNGVAITYEATPRGANYLASYGLNEDIEEKGNE